MLSFDQLTCFVALAEQGSFHGAAASLNCSQPTISHRLKRLEDDLQAVLIQRGRSGCQLSVAGSRFLPLARSILAIAQQANRVVKNQTVRVAACSNIGIYSMPPLIASFSSEHKRHDVCEFWLGSNPEVHERLIRAEADVAIMEWWDQREGFDACVWRSEELAVIVPVEHPWAKLASIPLDWLKGEKLLGGETSSGTGRLLQHFFGSVADSIGVSMQLGSTEAVKRAVQAGLGISLVISSSVVDECESGRLRSVKIEGITPYKNLYVICRSNMLENTPSAHFKKFLLQ